MRRGDEEFWGYIELIMDLDWKDYNLTIFGGITGNWDTPDIDGVLWGEYRPQHIKYLLEEMKLLGPWDLFYSQDEIARTWHTQMQPTSWNIAKPVDRGHVKARARFGGVWQDGLFWNKYKVPSQKQKQRDSRYKYNKPITLIQNGQQLYF